MQKAPGQHAQEPTRCYAGVEHAERIAQRHQRLIEAGVEQFGTLGYHATTMRTLTAAAGLSNRYFYESFDSMEALLMACYRHLLGKYRQRQGQRLDTAPVDLEARLRVGVRCFFEEMRNPHFARITQVEVLGVSSQVDALYIQSLSEFGGLIMDNMADAGTLSPSSTKRELEITGVALAGAMTTAGAMWVRSRYCDSIDTVTNATVTIMLGTARQLVQTH